MVENYGEDVFSTVIYRKASIGRLAIEGFVDNPELPDAIEQYIPFTKELAMRVGSRGQVTRKASNQTAFSS